MWGLTIHSSRRRFAARLNSGVRRQETSRGKAAALQSLRPWRYPHFLHHVGAPKHPRVPIGWRTGSRPSGGCRTGHKFAPRVPGLAGRPLGCVALAHVLSRSRWLTVRPRAYGLAIGQRPALAQAKSGTRLWALPFRRKLPPNNSFKPTPLRYAKHMAGTACHVLGSTTRRGLTQALGGRSEIYAHRMVALLLVHRS